MNIPAKWFLAGFFGLYAAVSLTLNALYGPPGMSRDYLEKYDAEHDRYLGITKDPAYRRHLQRPHLNPPDAVLERQIAFVKAYEARPEFVAEQIRRARYDRYFDVFKVVMVLLLIVRFGREPVLRLLDGWRDQVRKRIADSENEKREADARKDAARRQLESIDEVRARTREETEQRISAELAKVRENAAHALALLEAETADRLAQEELTARRALTAALVDEAIRVLTERYVAGRSAESEAVLIRRFAEQVEKMYA